MHPLDFLEIILKKLIYDNDELESISIQGKTNRDPAEIRKLLREIEKKRNLEKKINKEIDFSWDDAVL